MLDSLVCGIDRGIRALSETFYGPVGSYCKLETVDRGVLVADDGSLITVLRLEGALKQVGVEEYATIVRGLTEKMLTEANLTSLRLLNEMAHAREQTMAQMALSWLLKDRRVTSVLIGASRPQQLEENVQALKNLTFSAEELAQIDQHVADGQLNLWQTSSDK